MSEPRTPESPRRNRPAARPAILHRHLAPVTLGGVTCLDAVRSGETLRVFGAAGVGRDDLRPAADSPWALVGTRAIRGDGGRVLAFRPTAAAGRRITLLTAAGGALTLHPVPAEPGLLAGTDCLFAILNGEDPQQVADWLAYHAARHGAEAALLLNRLGPGGQMADLPDRLAAAAWSGGAPAQIVVVDIPVAVGRRDLPAAGHPYCAPDAPGQARGGRPAPDPWRAPLADGVLLELARHRFLSGAGAVCHLDPSDYVAPVAGGVFAAARRAASGVVRLAGQRLYPWAVKGNRPAGPGDHVCRPFDIGTGFARWCCAPDRIAADSLWRPHRILGAAPAAEPRPRLYRFMALRHPGVPTGRIVPRTSLVEDAAAVDFACDVLGAAPMRPPRPETRALAALPADRPPRVTIVTAMKNEGPFILEWLAYHRMIGVTDVLVYSNDCTDGTDRFLDLLERKGLVTHRVNPFDAGQGQKPQHAAFAAAETEPVVRAADWLMTLDVDEFINIHAGAGHLADLFAAIGDATLVSLTWRLFGNADIARFREGFLTRQFTRCAAPLTRKPHQAWGFKTLYRNAGLFRKLGVHRPKGLNPEMLDHVRWVNGSGRPMPRSAYRHAWRSTLHTYGYELATLNHYAVRSAESFLVKRDRGRVNHTARDQGLAYWFRMNHNTVEDRSIQRMLPALDRAVAGLLSDPEIAAMQAEVVARHRARIAALLARPDFAALHAALTGRRMRRLSRMLPHFGANVFLRGPDSVPDALIDEDLPADFFFTVDPPEDGQVH